MDANASQLTHSARLRPIGTPSEPRLSGARYRSVGFCISTSRTPKTSRHLPAACTPLALPYSSLYARRPAQGLASFGYLHMQPRFDTGPPGMVMGRTSHRAANGRKKKQSLCGTHHHFRFPFFPFPLSPPGKSSARSYRVLHFP